MRLFPKYPPLTFPDIAEERLDVLIRDLTNRETELTSRIAEDTMELHRVRDLLARISPFRPDVELLTTEDFSDVLDDKPIETSDFEPPHSFGVFEPTPSR